MKINSEAGFVFVALGALYCASASSVVFAENVLPMPCSGSLCGSGGPSVWVSSDATRLPDVDGLNMTINQLSEREIFNWQSFNIGDENIVHFDQPSSESVALNRIYQSDPSRIMGSLTADGQVFLLNQNGIVFGESAQINVHTLVATTLNITNENFEAGLLNIIDDQAAAFDGGDRLYVTDEAGEVRLFQMDGDEFARDNGGNLIPDADGQPYPIEIRIEDGVQIRSESGGRIMVLSQEIVNAGTLESPDGQVVLAAGNKVYLTASDEPELRGLLIEVDVNTVSDDELTSFLSDDIDKITAGTVTNTGVISSLRGNVSLIGLALNQQGRVSASSAVTANGSIRLLARDNQRLTRSGNVTTLTAQRTGRVVLAEGSLTEIDLDVDTFDDTAVSEQQIYDSRIDILARQFMMEENSEIVAPSGMVDIIAVTSMDDIDSAVPIEFSELVKVDLADDSLIDVSGTSAEMAMESNVLEIELRGNELSDSILQRDGVLRGTTIKFDLREVDEDGHLPIADVSGAVDNVQRRLSEREDMLAGGSVTIESAGSINFRDGAEIDISGGEVTYLDGYIETSAVVSNNRIYDISQADPDRTYDNVLGVATVDHLKWGVTETYVSPYLSGLRRFERGYVEGFDAGSVQFTSYQGSYNGTIQADTVAGRYQRNSADRALGGELTLGELSVLASGAFNLRTPDVLFADSDIVEGLEQTAASDENLVILDMANLIDNGVNRINIYSNGKISTSSNMPVNLGINGSLDLQGRAIDIQSGIRSAGGDIKLGILNIDTAVVSDHAAVIEIDDNVTLSSTGEWINDTLLLQDKNNLADELTAPILIDAGNISIDMSGIGDLSELIIGDNVTIDVSGGAWLNGNGEVIAGQPGAISIESGVSNELVELGSNLEFRAYGLESGGQLTLAAPEWLVWGDDSASSLAAQQTQSALGQSTNLSENEIDIMVEAVLADWQSESRDELSLAQEHIVNNALQNLVSDIDAAESAEQREALVQGYIEDSRAPLLFAVSQFSEGGFADISLTASRNDLIVMSGTQISPVLSNYQFQSLFFQTPTTAKFDALVNIAVLPDIDRETINLSLSGINSLLVEAGAGVKLDPLASLNLFSTGKLALDGVLSVPGGDVTLNVDYSERPFNIERMIHLGDTSLIDVSGFSQFLPNDAGLKLGQVYDGGSVNLIAAGAGIQVDEGALIDVSGVSEEIDIVSLANVVTLSEELSDSVQRQSVASNGGSITIETSGGLLFNGDFQAQGGNNSTALGGILSVESIKNPARSETRIDLGFDDPSNPVEKEWLVRLTNSDSGNTTELTEGLVELSVDKIESGGFSDLALYALEKVELEAGVSLSLDRSLSIDAPVLQVSVNDGDSVVSAAIDAPYIELGTLRSTTEISTAGTAELQVGSINTRLLDFTGSLVLTGINRTTLVSGGDIRFRGSQDIELPSELQASGELIFDAAQLYPATFSNFSISSNDWEDAETDQINYGRISIIDDSQQIDAAPVLSAGGSLEFTAANIDIDGTLKAPLGTINLLAEQRTLFDDVTATDILVENTGKISVSGLLSTALDVDLVPVGSTVAGALWRYSGDETINVYNEGVGQVPVQSMVLSGAEVDIETGATIDLSGGGDLVAYEFLPGPGGSQDVLTIDVAQAENTYAILPWLGDAPAAYDSYIYTQDKVETNTDDIELAQGQSIRLLEDSNGLAAGEYILLPARYALLPGAYLVTAVEGYQDIQVNQPQTLVDGTQVVAGQLATAGTELEDSRTSGFIIRTGDYARVRSEYEETHLSDFIQEQVALDEVALPQLPGDAGHIVINVEDSLRLAGDFITGAEGDGAGAKLDLIANRLVIAQADANPVLGEGQVLLSADQLNALDVDSILLGGRRENTEDGTEIEVLSEDIVVSQDTVLEGSELILVGTDALTIESGAVVNANRSEQEQADEAIIIGRVATETQTARIGEAAFVRVSSINDGSIVRRNLTSASGVLRIDDDALLAAAKSIALDATGGIQLNGNIEMAGGSLWFGANQISLGDVPDDVTGLVLSQVVLDNLNPEQLVLSSQGSINVFSPVQIGNLDSDAVITESLVLDSAAILGFINAGEASFSATNIEVLNSHEALTDTVDPGAGGQLSLNAETLILGDGDYQLTGFDEIFIAADNQLFFDGTNTLITDAALTLSSPLITGTNYADASIVANTTAVNLINGGQSVDETDNDEFGLGARLTISADAISQNTRVQFYSGRVTLESVGQGDVVIGGEGVIDVSGQAVDFGNEVQLATPGGDIMLSTVEGNIVAETGSSLDVSSPQISRGAEAGRIMITAASAFSDQGTVLLNGDLVGYAADDQLGGSMFLDTSVLAVDGTASNFSNLNAKLNQGGFFGERNLRLRTGDIEIIDDDAFAVRAERINVTADGGSILVNGLVDASADKGGSVELNALNDIVMSGTAQISAAAIRSDGDGGDIFLSSTDGFVELQSGSVIDVQGGVDGASGRLWLRAERDDTDIDGVSDVRVRPLEMTLLGTDTVTVEAFAVYDEFGGTGITTISQALRDAVMLDAEQYLGNSESTTDQNAQFIKQQLSSTDNFSIDLLPGVEIVSESDLNIEDDWNLSSSRFWNGENVDGRVPGVLTLKSSGNLNINASISDGFDVVEVETPLFDLFGNIRGYETTIAETLSTDDSWTLHLVGGADLSSSDFQRVLPLTELALEVVDSGTTVERQRFTGSVIVAEETVVRTGSGDIVISAGGNIELNDDTSVIYTLGQHTIDADDSGFYAARLPDGLIKEWPDFGGNLTLLAQQDIRGAISDQMISDWMWHQGGETDDGPQSEVSIDYSNFRQNVGALGGGDVYVAAGNDIDNLSVMLPTTLKQAGDSFVDGFITYGGGDLNLRAGNDILGGVFYVGDGVGNIRAYGEIGAGYVFNGKVVNPYLVLGEGWFDVTAGVDLNIESVFHSTILPQHIETNNSVFESSFVTLSDDSGVSLMSISGDVFLQHRTPNEVTSAASGTATTLYKNSLQVQANLEALNLYPGTLNIVAANGDINVLNNITLLPSPVGNLELLAGENVRIEDGRQLIMSDMDVNLLPTLNNPSTDFSIFGAEIHSRQTHASTAVHVGDEEPILVIADAGDISGVYSLPKMSIFVAGRDIDKIGFHGQNISEDDVTVLRAGRDFRFTASQSVVNEIIELGGPGRLDVIAGRNINLAASPGITTIGDSKNPGLENSGADLFVIAGLGGTDENFSDFIGRYFETYVESTASQLDFVNVVAAQLTNSGEGLDIVDAMNIYESMSESDKLAVLTEVGISESGREEFVDQLTDLAAFRESAWQAVTNSLGDESISIAEAIAQFSEIDTMNQRPVVYGMFFNELRESGRSAVTDGNNDYSRGYDAVEILFPDGNGYNGNIDMFLSRIYTIDGGDINILVPGGGVNGGLAISPDSLGVEKEASDLGVVAQREGDVNSYTLNDFIVNQSRVFTLLGGDILMWSNEGNLDAGKGAKTAISAPAPTITINDQGTVNIDFSSAVAGSGIRAITTDDANVVAGDVDLFAPQGIVDAGDAGIGATNITIGATQVVGAENIDIGGIAVGLPATDVSVDSSVVGVGGVASGATADAEDSLASNVDSSSETSGTPLADEAISFLEVVVEGFGEDAP